MAQNSGVIRRDAKGGGYVVLRYMATGFISLNSNTTIVGANSVGETVNNMAISHLWWNCSNGCYFTVKRGANTVAILSSGDDFDAQERGVYLDNLGGEATSNVQVIKTGTGPSMVVMKLHKQSAIVGGTRY